MPCNTCQHDPRCQDVCQHSSCATGQDGTRPLWDANNPRDGYVTDAEWAARRTAKPDTSDERLRAVLDVVLRWLTPDGIDSGDAMVEICGLVDPLPASPDVGKAQAPSPLDPVMREFMGRMVRMEWERWAREQPNPKASWLTPWDQLTEPEREVDRRIAEAIWRFSSPLAAIAQSAPSPVLLEAGKEDRRGL